MEKPLEHPLQEDVVEDGIAVENPMGGEPVDDDYDANELLTSPVYLEAKDDFSFNASASEGDFGVFECEPKGNISDSFSNSDSFACCSPQRLSTSTGSPRHTLHHTSPNCGHINMPIQQMLSSPSKNQYSDYNATFKENAAIRDASYESPLPYSSAHQQCQTLQQNRNTGPYIAEEPLRPPSRLLSSDRNDQPEDRGLSPLNLPVTLQEDDEDDDEDTEPIPAAFHNQIPNVVFEDHLLRQPNDSAFQEDFLELQPQPLISNDLPMPMSSVPMNEEDDRRSSPVRSFSTNSYFPPGGVDSQQYRVGGPVMTIDGTAGMDQQQMPLGHHQQSMPQSSFTMSPRSMKQSQHNYHGNMPQHQMNGMMQQPTMMPHHMSPLQGNNNHMTPQQMHPQQQQQQQQLMHQQQQQQHRFHPNGMVHQQNTTQHMQGGPMQQQRHGMHGRNVMPNFQQQQMQQPFHNSGGIMNNSSQGVNNNEQHFNSHSHQHNAMNNMISGPGCFQASSAHGSSSAFSGMHRNVSIATSELPSPKSHMNGYDPQGASPAESPQGAPRMNDIMEKLSETMRRSAMSRSMVKQYSSHNLVRHNSMRGLMVKQGSARSGMNGQGLGRHPSNRNLVSQGSNRNLMSQGSNRNLMSQGSNRNLISQGSNRNLISQGSDRNLSGDGMIARTPPARRMSSTSSTNAKHHLQHQGRGLMRHDSQQSLNGRSNHGISVQIDGRNVGMM